jgi:hypothetical protein
MSGTAQEQFDIVTRGPVNLAITPAHPYSTSWTVHSCVLAIFQIQTASCPLAWAAYCRFSVRPTPTPPSHRRDSERAKFNPQTGRRRYTLHTESIGESFWQIFESSGPLPNYFGGGFRQAGRLHFACGMIRKTAEIPLSEMTASGLLSCMMASTGE